MWGAMRRNLSRFPRSLPSHWLQANTTTIRISRATHDELRRLAKDRHQTVSETVSRAVLLLRQDQIGRELAAPLTGEEVSWLDADAG